MTIVTMARCAAALRQPAAGADRLEGNDRAFGSGFDFDDRPAFSPYTRIA
jgi:hypothetical protein